MKSPHAARQMTKRSLAVKWLKQNRPDIWELIVKEAETLFPRREHGFRKTSERILREFAKERGEL